jgi:hypothetical protein
MTQKFFHAQQRFLWRANATKSAKGTVCDYRALANIRRAKTHLQVRSLVFFAAAAIP